MEPDENTAIDPRGKPTSLRYAAGPKAAPTRTTKELIEANLAKLADNRRTQEQMVKELAEMRYRERGILEDTARLVAHSGEFTCLKLDWKAVRKVFGLGG